jgi:hypothetical protein
MAFKKKPAKPNPFEKSAKDKTEDAVAMAKPLPAFIQKPMAKKAPPKKKK